MAIIIWHRRDLRIDDHPALARGVELGKEIIGVFTFDPQILRGGMTGTAQVSFMLACLRELQQNYRQLGSDLWLFMGDAVEVLSQLAQELPASVLLFNQDVEPYALKRDRTVTEALQNLGIKVESFLDISLINPRAIATQLGDPYRVFTPFWRNWSSLPKPQPYARPVKILGLANQPDLPGRIGLPSLADLGFAGHDLELPIAGEAAAQQLLQDFCQPLRLLRYQEQRNFPAIAGTSGLSPHLRFGTVGIRRVWAEAIAIQPLIQSNEAQESLQTWQQELAWREFYQHVLLYFPELEQRAYRPQMQRFVWDQDQDRFRAWCAGKTGFPIVDAAMRQLNQTGWMHNRCRMIVASFLTKDLLLNWQWGEKYFMQNLVDGDLAANNGGWQWSASSGMDPKPLRIFNPAAQAKKFDPQAEYIRQYLPEIAKLRDVELISGNIHPQKCRALGYPQPIVSHEQQQKVFKQRYAEAKL
ncbi:MAG: deoxyribodipyrimidine photo-lyase [Pseudanabaenaceae cyanobacterium bins.68]|nr:deoxyribodipyrimidine photo-lyase [Pseudanabaenaceae cyanobacterium bins.68]